MQASQKRHVRRPTEEENDNNTAWTQGSQSIRGSLRVHGREHGRRVQQSGIPKCNINKTGACLVHKDSLVSARDTKQHGE